MEITYTYTKKQVVEILDIQPAELEKLVKTGRLTRVRKVPGNNKSTWLYSAQEIDTVLNNCSKTEPCCQEININITAPKKKWYRKWF